MDKASVSCLNRYFDQFFCCNPEGRSGGVFLCWNSGVLNINELSASSRYIHVLVKDVRLNVDFATFVYVYSQKSLQENLWGELLGLNPGNKPWIVLGDFNCITNI